MTSKIHRATVTQADLDYVGSITVDVDLLEAADLLPGELVEFAVLRRRPSYELGRLVRVIRPSACSAPSGVARR